jgi:hypothetical protein
MRIGLRKHEGGCDGDNFEVLLSRRLCVGTHAFYLSSRLILKANFISTLTQRSFVSPRFALSFANTALQLSKIL